MEDGKKIQQQREAECPAKAAGKKKRMPRGRTAIPVQKHRRYSSKRCQRGAAAGKAQKKKGKKFVSL